MKERKGVAHFRNIYFLKLKNCIQDTLEHDLDLDLHFEVRFEHETHILGQ